MDPVNGPVPRAFLNVYVPSALPSALPMPAAGSCSFAAPGAPKYICANCFTDDPGTRRRLSSARVQVAI